VEFVQKVTDLSARSRHASKYALTEEATKTAVVFPFIQCLGFDVFNLEEVTPEFIADVGIKKGEKIDFAIRINGKIAILLEAKPISMSLGSAQYSQLFRYFATEQARLAILTNGREIWFFSDIDEKNKMDKKPFFIFDLQNYDEHQVLELARFQKGKFDIESILDAASNLKYVKAAGQYISSQLSSPDDDFVKMIGREIYEGSLTKAVVEQLRTPIKAALDEVVRNRIQERLNITFGKEASSESQEKLVDQVKVDSEVITTEEETQAFMIIRAVAARVISVNRITMRDAKSYCSIFVDDNNRKPVCRLYFNSKSGKQVGVFDSGKNETKHQIADLSEIYTLAPLIEAAIAAHS
jgi:predicted type IV restriction endonuclease